MSRILSLIVAALLAGTAAAADVPALLKAADAWFAQKGIDKTTWDKAVAKARMPAQGKVKRPKRDSIFEGARFFLAGQGVPEDQYPPKQLGFTTEEFGMDRIARKGLERLQWELDRYEPFAFSVYDGPTPDVKSVTMPRRMPLNMSAGELEQVSPDLPLVVGLA